MSNPRTKSKSSQSFLRSETCVGVDSTELQRKYESSPSSLSCPSLPVETAPEVPPPSSALVAVTAADDDVLARLESVPQILAEVTDAFQAKEALTAARVIENYAKEKRVGEEILRLAFRFKSLAKRRLGEILAAAKAKGELAGQGGDRKSKSSLTTLKLSDLAISKDESAQAQAYAAVPEAKFEELVGSVGLSDTALWRAVNESKQGKHVVAAARKERKPHAMRKREATRLAPAELAVAEEEKVAIAAEEAAAAEEVAEAAKRVQTLCVLTADDPDSCSLTTAIEYLESASAVLTTVWSRLLGEETQSVRVEAIDAEIRRVMEMRDRLQQLVDGGLR
jgi:hypothetical protein